MQYQKIVSGAVVIEFHNSWSGEETVFVNGQIVSKQYSVWGTQHYFTGIEAGCSVRYILTSKVTPSMQVMLDLSKNGQLIEENVPVAFGSMPKKSHHPAKKQGLLKLKEFDLEAALSEFETALDIDPKDPEIYFHMACAHSVMENALEGFECLKKAIATGLQNQEMILNHDMLAYLRMHPAFEGFLNSGFVEFDEKAFQELLVG